MEHITLNHRDILGPDATFEMARVTLATARPKMHHTHDFYELLWVQNGTLRHHIADTRSDLTEGDLLFIRPEDTHALQGRGEEALVVSLTIKPGFIRALGNRHDDLAGRFFWSDAPRPAQIHRDIRQLSALNQAALRLERGPRSGLALEAFLLPLLSDLCDTPHLPAGAPDWLHAACVAAQEPRVFRDGAAGFARAAGRAHPHVSRTARRFLGQSPSDYVNGIRMAHAARQLTGTEETLADIAADIGLPNLSHFHKLFLSHHGETPQRYRRARQRETVQPGT